MASSHSGNGHPRVGIEKMNPEVSTLMVDLEDLARARDHDPEDLRNSLLVRSRSINPLWEDPVTMAINAAKPMLTDEDREKIELLVVATESSVDQGKPMSTYAQRFLGINANCRNYESKGACHAATSAVMMAAHWIASGVAGDKKALVICTDQSRCHIGEAYEYVMGAGAVAILVSANPKVVAFELGHNGYWTNETSDTLRPTSLVETGNGEASLYAYLDALEGSYEHYLSKAGDIDWDSYFKKHVYHVPFGGITFQGHRRILSRHRRMKKSQAWEHFCRKSKAALTYNCQTGSLYSGSTFMALMGTIDHNDDLEPGDRVSVFSYGSGSNGEFYSTVVCPEAKDIVHAARVQEKLDARTQISIEQYETLERKRLSLVDCGNFEPSLDGYDDLYARRYQGKDRLVVKRNKDYFLEYGWS